MSEIVPGGVLVLDAPAQIDEEALARIDPVQIYRSFDYIDEHLGDNHGKTRLEKVK